MQIDSLLDEKLNSSNSFDDQAVFSI